MADAPDPPRPTRAPALLALFLLSGAAGLIYQVVWARQLGQVFGSSTESVATVLAAFMAGFAFGGRAFARWAPRLARPMVVYGVLELAIAVLGALLTFVVPRLGGVSELLAEVLGSGRGPLTAGRFVVVTALLFLPTFLMGGTLPVLTRHLAGGSTSGRTIAVLYAVNTLGAVVGCLAPDFFLVPELGMLGTALVACGANVVAGGLALALGTGAAPRTAALAAPSPRAAGSAATLAVIGLSGGVAMGYEVVWTRLNTFLAGSQVFQFSALLGVYLLGLAIGSALVAPWIDRVRSRRRLLGGLEVAAALAVAAGIVLFPYLDELAPALQETFVEWFAAPGGDGRRPPRGVFLAAMLSAVATDASFVLLPTMLFGATVPVAARVLVDGGEAPSAAIGRVYFWNTLIGIPGALLAGFVLLPALGSQATVLGLAALQAIVGAAYVWPARRPRLPLLTLAGAPAVVVLAIALPGDYVLRRTYVQRYGELFTFREGAHQTLAVVREELFGRPIREQLVTDSFNMTARDFHATRYMKLMAHLPLFLAEDPKSACLICFGLGSTLEGLASHDELEEIVVVDISKEVFDIYRALFPEGGALADPRVRTIADDGRNHLLTCGRTYDVITLEPPPPNVAGVVNLYSTEFYELGRSRLSPGGAFCQWMPVGDALPVEMRSMFRSFVDVFPNATLWQGSERQAVLVGTMDDAPLDPARIVARAGEPRVRADLESIAVGSTDELFGTLLMGPAQLREYVAKGRPIRDDEPVLPHSIVFWSPLQVDPTLFLTPPDWEAILRRPDGWDEARYGEFLARVRAEQEFWRGVSRQMARPAGLAAPEWAADRDERIGPLFDERPGHPVLYMYAGIHPRRLAACEAAVASGAADADAHGYVGRARLYAGDAAAARDHFERALAGRPADAAALRFLYGRALEELGERDAAAAAYRRAMTEFSSERFRAAVSRRLAALDA